MDTFRNLTLESETVALDGKHFIDCIFSNCILEYSGGSVILEQTHLRGCHYVFFGQAQMTVRLLQNIGLMPFAAHAWEELGELVH